MEWYVDFFDGTQLSESKINYNLVDKKNIKKIYFKDLTRSVFGIDVLSKSFFINNSVFDIKISGEIIDIIQYKEASLNLRLHNTKIKSWNLGIMVQNDDLIEKYVMSISFSGSIRLIASKIKDNVLIDEKIIQLK